MNPYEPPKTVTVDMSSRDDDPDEKVIDILFVIFFVYAYTVCIHKLIAVFVYAS